MELSPNKGQIMTKTKTMTPLELAHAARSKQGLQTKKAVIDSLRSATQPVTVGEVQQYLEKKRGVKLHSTYIRQLLVAASKDGLVFSRAETLDEQNIRGGSHVRLSILFWAGGRKIPDRTSREVYAGIVSRPVSDMKVKKKAKKTVRPGRTLSSQTDKINFLIESKNFNLPQAESLETFKLRIRISELESQLSAIKKLLS
jgi:hypothetical protein